MRVRFFAALAFSASAAAIFFGPCAAVAGETPVLVAQGAYPAIPQPSARRAGELEDWSSSDKKPAAKAAPSKKKASAAVARPNEKAAAKKEARDPDDGGLPLPSSRKSSDDAPVGFDSKGNVGTNLRF